MSIFDLLFLLLVLATAISLIAVGWFLLRRQWSRAGRVLLRLLACAVVYFVAVVLTSLVLPRKVMAQGTPRCFDDWCIGVAGFNRVPRGDSIEYRVDFRLSSRALRVTQRENNLAVYLTDDQGRRYDPVNTNSEVPFSVRLEPQEAVVVSRDFVVPAGSKDVGVVITHEGGFPIGWLIIGYETWFRKPTLVRMGE